MTSERDAAFGPRDGLEGIRSLEAQMRPFLMVAVGVDPVKYP